MRGTINDPTNAFDADWVWILTVLENGDPDISLPDSGSRVVDQTIYELENASTSFGEFTYIWSKDFISFTYSIENTAGGLLPDWLAFNPLTRNIEVVAATPPGVYTFFIIATLDDPNTTANRDMIWTLTVLEIPPPVITIPAAARIKDFRLNNK